MIDSDASSPISGERHASPARAWLALLAILIVCAPSLLLGIKVRLSTHTMENVALVTSQETWLRMAEGESKAWLVSMNDGVARLEKPPMLAWLSLLAWSDLDPATATPQQLTFRARCVTAALGLMMLAAIFWMGRTLGDLRMAALAALAVGSTLFFQRQSRTASYDIHFVAWTTLAVASGLWAMRPFGPPASLARRVIGWGLCAVALFAAVMSKNPLPYLLALPPLIAAIVMVGRPGGRRADSIGLIAAVLLSAAPVALWYWHVFEAYPDMAERALGREVRQPRAGDFQPIYYYLGLLGLVFPWTLWLIGGLIEPFKIADRSRRRAALLAFIWFALVFVGFSIPAAKQQRYILTIMPAVGLLLSAFFREHDDRAGESRPDRLFEVIAAGTWIVLGLLSLLMPVFFAEQDWFVTTFARWMEEPEPAVAQMPWLWAMALAVGLLAVAFAGWRWRACSPWKSAVAMALWMVLLMTAYWRQESLTPPRRVQAFVDEAARVRSVVGDAPLRSLRWNRRGGDDRDEPDFFWKINEEFRFYYGRLIRRAWRDDFDAWLAQQQGEVCVLVRGSPEKAAFLAQRGFELIDHARVDTDDRQELWRWRPPA
jgi:4-amino-4-deoxy-L-arabinose transferase-like glycosyltransferase